MKYYSEKTANILWCRQGSLQNDIWETRFHTDNASLSRSGLCLWLDKTYLEPIRSTIQIWVVTHHQYGIFGLVSKMSFCWRTSVVVFFRWNICQKKVQVRQSEEYTQIGYHNFLIAQLSLWRDTVEPGVTATSVIQSPCCYSHFFWPLSKNHHTFSCKETFIYTVTT